MGTQIVTIKSFIPIYKDDAEANNICIALMEELAFEVVVQKSLYQVGDKALFIFPDYNLPDTSLFESYVRPQGDPKKSKLGKMNRVRAIKFNFYKEDGSKVYSNGILLPIMEVIDYVNGLQEIRVDSFDDSTDFDNLLNITKYEEPEEDKVNIGKTKGTLPLGMYKTDETNILSVKNFFEKHIDKEFIGSIKYDGSSISIYYKDSETFGICSRLLEKKLYDENYKSWISNYFNVDKTGQKHGSGYLNETTNEFVLKANWEEYLKNNEIEKDFGIANDDWVQLGFPFLEKLKEYSKPIVLRGEIFGSSLKGSGNKNNPHAKLPKSIAFYGADDYSTGIAVPLSMNEFLKLSEEIGFPTVDIVFKQKFESFDQLQKFCSEYFETKLQEGICYEGIVVRTFDSNLFSAKLMNLHYDSLK